MNSDISDWPLSIQSSSKHLRLSKCLLLPPLGSEQKVRPNNTVIQQATSRQPQSTTILRWTQIKIFIHLSEASLLCLCPWQTQAQILATWRTSSSPRFRVNPLQQEQSSETPHVLILLKSSSDFFPSLVIQLEWCWVNVSAFGHKYCKANCY
jgi:hypothetical protein